MEAAAPVLALQLGPDLPPAAAQRIESHLKASSPLPVVVADSTDTLAWLPASSVRIGLGDTTTTHALIAADALAALGPEAFEVRSGTVQGMHALAAAGNSLDASQPARIGTAFGAYRLLEEMGFAFAHPLAPVVPAALSLDLSPPDIDEKPYWPVRGIQLHTMHPLELTDLLQGWGPGGNGDEAGWKAMLPEWDSFLEWMLASGQNRVHWLLLYADAWSEFADSPVRQQRLKQLVDRAHDFGLLVGVDAQIAMVQQHAWRLVRTTGELSSELAQIDEHVDWLMLAGFDYLATENGTTEFTHPDDDRMLAWMNEVTARTSDHWGKEAIIKAHCSTGQVATTYLDPQTQQPLNFNFLPHYADARLGIMPHTVEHYSLDDPAPTYGNADFGYMRDFLHLEAGSRRTIWHPETAYWVSYDIDVPLFLPLYADRRLYDLRLLASDEQQGKMGVGVHQGSRMDGQITFSSGWEWGYWLQDWVTARAAWNPRMNQPVHELALRETLRPLLAVFGESASGIEDALIDAMVLQHDLLTLGKVGGVAPSSVVRRNGQAYLQGVETWDDVSALAAGIPSLHASMTQPDKLGLVDMLNPLHDPPGYSAEVEPLLAELETRLDASAGKLEALASAVSGNGRPLIDDLAASARITALRARQVHALYDYVDGKWDKPDSWRQARLAVARKALDDALLLVQTREASYRVPVERVAAWRPNPTAYGFTYLWTVHNLFYWWRDEGKAVHAPVSPCYMNIIDPIDVGLGEGVWMDAASVLSELGKQVPGIGSLTECSVGPKSEPPMPPPGMRP